MNAETENEPPPTRDPAVRSDDGLSAATFYRKILEQICDDTRNTRAKRLAASALTFWDQMRKAKGASEGGLLKLKVVRDDSIPAFGAWHSCTDQECPNNNVILLNLEAMFGPQVYEDGSPADPMSSAQCVDVLIETLMHEFGHALQGFFKVEFDEAQLERITKSFRQSADNP